MKIITADNIFYQNKIHKNLCLEIDHYGFIKNIFPLTDELSNVLYLKGDLIPGLINTHCHLELSYLQGKISEGIGMTNFIQNIQKIRNDFTEKEIYIAIENSLEEMKSFGIKAVGDICNTNWTAKLKQESKIQFRNFIEIFGLNYKMNKEKIEDGYKLMDQFDYSSLTFHSFYSCNKELIERILQETNSLSVHYLESQTELEYLKSQTGDIQSLYKNWGFDFNFKIFGLNESHEFLEKQKNPILLVHCSKNNYIFKNKNIHLSLCPISNLHLHNFTIDTKQYENQDFTIGTDSLASNNSINMQSEIIWLLEHFEKEKVYQSITTNGAKALNFKDLGEFKIGTNPGINVIDNSKIKVLFN